MEPRCHAQSFESIEICGSCSSSGPSYTTNAQGSAQQNTNDDIDQHVDTIACKHFNLVHPSSRLLGVKILQSATLQSKIARL